MEHCAIDIGGRKSQVCVRRSDGTIVHESRCETQGLRDFLRELPRSRVVLETCAEAFRIADAAREAGHEVRVVPATLVRTLGVGARQTKTDRRDAQVLSEVSCRIDLPSVHVPSQRSREWKTMCGMRDALVGSRTQLINNLRGWLRGTGVRVRRGYLTTLAERVRELSGLPASVEAQLRVLEVLNREIKQAGQAIEELAETDALCRRLMTIPGIGPIAAVRFVAAVDQVERFPSAHRLESYLGLAPGENSSSESQHRLSITKAGSSQMRWTLVQAAWSLRGCRRAEARPLQLWAAEIEKRRGKWVAVIALARKLSGLLFALWREGTTYDPRRAAAH